MSEPSSQPLRQELQEAIAKVRHQIEVQAISDHYVGSGDMNALAIGELQAELEQLEAALSDLG
ncbi:MAG TPA: hypothetical protein VMU59_06535 [Caulobacteraceae bacterium]|nr:hypothetical protein [Caulobacteraceae bacterium]